MATKEFPIMKARHSIDFNIPNTIEPSAELLRFVRDPNYVVDQKLDGTRAIIDIDSQGNIVIYGRGEVQDTPHSETKSQRIYNSQFPELVQTIKIPSLANSRLDAELVIHNPETKKIDYNLLETRVNRKDNIKSLSEQFPADVKIFDVQMLQGDDLTKMPLYERRKLLESSFDIFSVNPPHYSILPQLSEVNEKMKLVKSLLSDSSVEGVMVKDMNSIYKDGSGDWWKSKRTYTDDVVILGISPGKGKFEKYFGKLHGYHYDPNSRQFKWVCDIGGGFDFSEMLKIKQYFGNEFYEKVLGKDTISRYQDLVNKKMIMVAEVKYYGQVKEGYRHPTFIRWRSDKGAEDCLGRGSSVIEEQSALEEFF